jgi:lysophospholipase L1-like esterase
VSVFAALHDHGPWLAEVRSGDGSHPGADGYGQLADLVWTGGWTDWLDIT